MAKRPRNQDKAAAKPAGTGAALPRALSAGSLLVLGAAGALGAAAGEPAALPLAR
jgi:hypothetical protein